MTTRGVLSRADYGDLSVVSVYHPSGTTGDARQAFKMKWLEDFQHYIGELKKVRPNLILCGDYNICHRPIDIHDPVGMPRIAASYRKNGNGLGDCIDTGFIDTFRSTRGGQEIFLVELPV